VATKCRREFPGLKATFVRIEFSHTAPSPWLLALGMGHTSGKEKMLTEILSERFCKEETTL
jgi:hypothetical protein